VLETLRYIHHETDTWLEITTLLIRQERLRRRTAGDERVDRARARPEYRCISAPSIRLQDERHPPTRTNAHAGRAIALQAGLHYVYTGNVHDTDGGTTYCRPARHR